MNGPPNRDELAGRLADVIAATREFVAAEAGARGLRGVRLSREVVALLRRRKGSAGRAAQRPEVPAQPSAKPSPRPPYRPSVARPAPERAPDDKAAALAAVEKEALACTACPLHRGRTNVVFGAGDPHADIVFIGEAPGRDEDLEGKPFVGRAGRRLTQLLQAADLRRDEVYICNVLKCRPPNNRDPQDTEIRRCEPFLHRQLEIIQPKVICALGRIAASTLLRTTAPLGQLRGQVFTYRGIKVVATYHPAAILRNPRLQHEVLMDLQRVLQLCRRT